MPPAPALYHQPETIEDLLNQTVRQRLKTGPAPAPTEITARLRSQVQKIEIDAEKIELDELDALIPELSSIPASGSETECAAAAIKTVIATYSRTALDNEDRQAIDTIASAAAGCQGRI